MYLTMAEEMQMWIERISLVNEEFAMHRGESPSQILIRIREIRCRFIPLFRGDDSIGRDGFE